MAVEIPVVIDIDKAFQDAAKRVSAAIKPLQERLSRNTLKIDLVTEIDKKGNVKAMRNVNDLLKSSTVSANELRNAMADVMARIRTMEAAGGFNPAKGLKKTEREMLALYSALDAKMRGGNLIKQTAQGIARIGREASVAGKHASSAVENTNAGLRAQGGILGMLTGYLSAYTVLFSGIRLIRNIRETTAEFEMQRVALGGIIQDATRANQLFGQIKAAAVESPFEIKDLVSFTKQLSAYRIETDKLFDVTMRLADVSAGLGVDMSRLVLAYGQVRAASVLRGQELRQFTEAGIPLVDLLAKKFTQLRGELVSTGEVFELISERAVPFAMIEEIFNDMTNAGGIFYQMQIKQSETLKGQWMKLKDVVSIAYDEMGRSALVNQAMTGWIKMISNLVKSWERIASVVNVAVWSYIAYKAAAKGIIPLYNMQQKAIERQIKLEKQQQIEQIRLASKTDKLTAADQRRIAQIKKMTAEDLKRIYAMDKMTQSQAMMFFWRNKDNKEIVKAITQTGILSSKQMNAIKNMSIWQLRIKTWGTSIRTFFTSIGTAIASFWPIAAVSALLTSLISLKQAHEEQEKAVERVDKAYTEQEQTLLTIENAYRSIQKAIADVSDEQERASAEAASFGQKLAYAQKVVEALKKFGLGGDFDLSLLNTENIDNFVDEWLKQLNLANELTRDWGRNVAQVANAWEASILGIHFAGDNLNTDIKQLTSAFVKLTGDKQYRQDVGSMRNYIDQLQLQHKEYYDLLSQTIGEDAKLAIAQKRRNESEYQYQKRLIKNYETIRQFAQSDQFLLSGAMKAFKPMNDILTNFEVKLNEVEREFEKTWGAMEGQDEITIKMAIDKMFAENQWEDWLKEAWIERVNGKYNMNIQLTPTISRVNVPQGMKGIIASEFSGLFTEQELENMNSVTEIGKAIEEKMKSAATAIAEAEKESNNLANSDLWASKTKEKIQKAQLTIDAELAKAEKDRNKDAINEAISLIDALTKQNNVYDEQIAKKKESAKAEYELAKAAKERLLNEGLSDMGKDIRQTFPELMRDVYKEATDESYAGRFLISDDDLAKIKDGVDAYDLWAKNVKAIADEREKLAQAGVSEAIVAEEQARLDAERIALTSQLEEVEEKLAAWGHEDVMAKYDSLRLAVLQATTSEERKKAEENLANFVRETNFEERAALVVEQQRLTAQLGITNAALGAKTAIADTFAAMDSASKLWEEFGKRYNFTLKNTPKGGSGQDPWILLFKNRMKFMQDFQKGVESLDKYLANSEALGKERNIMKGRGLSLGIKTEDLMGTPDELKAWYDKAIKEVVEKIQKMGGKQFAGLGVTEILAKDLTGRKIQKYQELLQELWKAFTDFDLSQEKKTLEDSLKKLSEEIKRSEAAKKFYENILGMTGDEKLSADMTMQIYGNTGDLAKQMQEQLSRAFVLDDSSITVDDSLKKKIANAIAIQDYKTLRQYLQYVVDDNKKAAEDILDNWESADADYIQDLYKTYEKTKTYEERMTAVRKREQEARAKIASNKNLTEAQKTEFTNASQAKEAKEIAEIQLEALKDTYTWTKAFEDLEGVSDRTLTNLISLIDEYIEKFGKGLSPKQLKELSRQREQAEEELISRNAFKGLTDAIRKLNEARQRANKIEKKGEKDSEEYTMALDDQRKAIKNLETALGKLQEYFSQVTSSAKDLMTVFGSDEDASYFSEQIDNISKTISGASNAAVGIAQIATGNITPQAIMQTITGLSDVVSGIFGAKNAANLRKINKQIDEQDRLLSQLTYSYGRLEAAIAKAFGSDYIYNYNEQLKNLQAQQAAYEKQAELESQKGKKKDQQKIEEYAQSAKEVEDQILDMQSQLSEFFSGTDLTSAAEDFANAWIEAYMEFGSTTDAISEKFKDMVNNMIVKSLAGKAMQNLLRPIFDEIDNLALDGELTAAEIGRISAMATAAIPQINDAMTGLMNNLTTAGIDLRTHAGQFTGISRDIAGASEESILGLSAAVNTANFYISHVPAIAENVAAIRGALVGDTPANVRTTASEGPTYEDQMLGLVGSIPQMRDDMAAMRSMLERVIKPVGVSATHYVAVR